MSYLDTEIKGEVEDFARSIIREFLIKKDLAETYQTLEREDTRPKQKVTKNQLARSLGLETLIRRNKARKRPFNTMLEVLVDFLAERRVNRESNSRIGTSGAQTTTGFFSKTEQMEANSKVETFDNDTSGQDRFWKSEVSEGKFNSAKDKEESSKTRMSDNTQSPGETRKDSSEIPKDFYPEIDEKLTILPTYPESFNYNNPFGGEFDQFSVERAEIGRAESQEVSTLLFGNVNGRFNPNWKQGFFYNQEDCVKYGLWQNEGGPCGILAAVQGYILKHMMFISTAGKTPNQNQQKNCLVGAFTDILWGIREANIRKNYTERDIYIAYVSEKTGSQIPKPENCSKHVLHFEERKGLFRFIHKNFHIFTCDVGVVLFAYSAILTKGAANIRREMDFEANTLIGSHGYCTQDLVNLLLTGDAYSNVFNGVNRLDKDMILKGVEIQSDIGFLTLFERYGHCNVGTFYKCPKYPVWVICSESHYSVIFSENSDIILGGDGKFDLNYYDELARQDEEIHLTVEPGSYVPPGDDDLVPPIDDVIRTKWARSQVDWNGREPFL